MEPTVRKRDTKLHLSYELPHRIYTSCTYPVIAPNGSTVIVYGHDRGVRILWRGGRRRKDARPEQQQLANGRTHNGAIHISDDDEHMTEGQNEQSGILDDLFELQEDEQDPDSPYPGIVHDVEIDLETEVLSMAVPSRLSVQSVPDLLRTHAIIAFSSADGGVAVLTVPLSPPSSRQLHNYIAKIKRSQLILRDRSVAISNLVVKAGLSREHASEASNSDLHDLILVSATSNTLDFWELQARGSKLVISDSSGARTIALPSPGQHPSFHPSTKVNWLSYHDKFGVVRIYDPLGGPSLDKPESQRIKSSERSTGEWVMSFLAPYHEAKGSPALIRRKHILDAQWVLGGRGIMVVLEDGEWGIWDVTGQSQTGKNVQQFAVGGYLDASGPGDVASVGKPAKGASKLAPMTPNTRKTKAENLFSGPSKPRASSVRAGICVSSSRARSGLPDEDVVIWYGNDIFTITGMQAFWQRSLSGGSGPNSLYAPGLIHLNSIDLMQEEITSISQFAPSNSSNALGNMNTASDLLISTEHRIIVVQSARAASRSRNLFEHATTKQSTEPTMQDQRMLDAGELNLGGVDRMLDSMANDNRPRKVGFASS